jgi:hypothetical protein
MWAQAADCRLRCRASAETRLRGDLRRARSTVDQGRNGRGLDAMLVEVWQILHMAREHRRLAKTIGESVVRWCGAFSAWTTASRVS